jgi:hypothetical protein
MQNEHSALNVIVTDAHLVRVQAGCELFRAELESFIEPAALAEMLDLAARAAQNAPVDEILRQMRAAIAGLMLDRVGKLMVATQPAIEGRARETRPPMGRGRAAA